MNTFKLHIITPTREVYSGDVVKILTRSSEGPFEIYANHISYITNVIPTITKFVDVSGKDHVLFTSTGVVGFSNNELTFCCDAAEWPDEIDVERAQKAKTRAEERLKNSTNVDVKRAQMALSRAVTRLDLRNL
ncbi:ATP synthase epsilon chain [Clostridium polyendosporum]|uniref:ATP synthase epsilon chain n=1 Tax=Clostridium polyendosporum TaxID=69208 RepID=A0A919S1N5_9CLOT|nr:F0F1 ATP synthase subunit epsilon [Clostridium polyendosporum]GIM29681.1 ATP synthase epsilon chain [Clostridium polyendosporum]